MFDFKYPALSYIHVNQAKHPQLTVVGKYFTSLTFSFKKNYEKILKLTYFKYFCYRRKRI